MASKDPARTRRPNSDNAPIQPLGPPAELQPSKRPVPSSDQQAPSEIIDTIEVRSTTGAGERKSLVTIESVRMKIYDIPTLRITFDDLTCLYAEPELINKAIHRNPNHVGDKSTPVYVRIIPDDASIHAKRKNISTTMFQRKYPREIVVQIWGQELSRHYPEGGGEINYRYVLFKGEPMPEKSAVLSQSAFEMGPDQAVDLVNVWEDKYVAFLQGKKFHEFPTNNFVAYPEKGNGLIVFGDTAALTVEASRIVEIAYNQTNYNPTDPETRLQLRIDPNAVDDFRRTYGKDLPGVLHDLRNQVDRATIKRREMSHE